jgi:hypothetical protein
MKIIEKLVKIVKMHIEPARVVAQNMVVTFIEAGFVAWQLAGYKLDKITLGAAAGVGVSAIWNMIVKPYVKHLGWMKG